MNKFVRDSIGKRCWAVVADRRVVEVYKEMWSGRVTEQNDFFTAERVYVNRSGEIATNIGVDDLYETREDADVAAFNFALKNPIYMDHLSVEKVA